MPQDHLITLFCFVIHMQYWRKRDTNMKFEIQYGLKQFDFDAKKA